MRDMAADGEIPDALANRPELDSSLLWVWQAFTDLNADRPMGVGQRGSIPFTALDTWARRFQITGDRFGVLHLLIKRMDDALRQWKPPQEDKT